MAISRLAIGMPSNRHWAESRDAIESALHYCSRNNYLLVVSDNSGDAEKAAACRALMTQENFKYIESKPCGMMENWYQVFDATQDADFVLIMGDDDTIFSFAPMAPIENLGSDVMGVKPDVFSFSLPTGITKLHNGAMLGATGVERINQNLQFSAGSNIAFFTFWRRDLYKSIMSLWHGPHPTRGLYCDWAVIHAMMSSGKVLRLPTSCYYYNLQNWAGTQSQIDEQVERAYVKSGLPAGSSAYHGLFNAVDSFIFINRQDSPLAAQERLLSAIHAFNLYYQGYSQTPPAVSAHANAAAIFSLSQKLNGLDDVPQIFAVIADIFEAIQQGLGEKYKFFYEAAIGKPWGMF